MRLLQFKHLGLMHPEPVSVGFTQGATLRLPIYLNLVTAALALAVTLSTREPNRKSKRTMVAIGFFLSYYLNALVESHRRAAVLSLKGRSRCPSATRFSSDGQRAFACRMAMKLGSR
jgi:hypothetical protein